MSLDIHPTCYSVKAYLLSAVFKNIRPPKGGLMFKVSQSDCTAYQHIAYGEIYEFTK